MQAIQEKREADTSKHSLILNARSKLSVSGVEDVINFDENGVILKTVAGILSVDGSDLRITNLNVEKGDVDIEGNVNGMYYTTAQSGKSSKTLKRRL